MTQPITKTQRLHAHAPRARGRGKRCGWPLYPCSFIDNAWRVDILKNRITSGTNTLIHAFSRFLSDTLWNATPRICWEIISMRTSRITGGKEHNVMDIMSSIWSTGICKNLNGDSKLRIQITASRTVNRVAMLVQIIIMHKIRLPTIAVRIMPDIPNPKLPSITISGVPKTKPLKSRDSTVNQTNGRKKMAVWRVKIFDVCAYRNARATQIARPYHVWTHHSSTKNRSDTQVIKRISLQGAQIYAKKPAGRAGCSFVWVLETMLVSCVMVCLIMCVLLAAGCSVL